MASPIFSKRFFDEQGVTALTTVGPVPAGKVWIVRDIDAYTSTTFTQVMFVRAPSGGTFMFGRVSASSQDGVQWRGRQVLNAGETMVIDTVGHPWDVMISGYELSA